MHFQGSLLLVLAIPNIILGSFILLRNTRQLTNLFFGGFILTVALWSFGLSQYFFSKTPNAATAWALEYYADATLIVITFLLFSLSFTGHLKKVDRRYYWLLAGLAVIVNLLVFSSMIKGIAYHGWGKEVLLDKSVYRIYCLFEVACIVSGFYVLVRALRNAHGIYRSHLKLIIWGLAIAFGLGATFNLIFPVVGDYRYVWVGPLFTLAYISLVSYAIIKNKLFDIRSVVIRTFAYILSLAVTALLVTVPILLSINHFLDNRLSDAAITGLAAMTLLVAIIFQLLKPYFNKTTNRLFYRDYYDPQAVLDELSNLLVGSVDIEDIERKSAAILKNALKPEFVRFYLKSVDTESQPHGLLGFLAASTKDVIALDETSQTRLPGLFKVMSENNIALAARLSTRHKELGFVTFGYKRSGSPYIHSDMQLVSIASDEIAVGLQNALHFAEIQQFNVTLQQKVDDATAQLRQANHRLKELDQTKDEFISMASHQLRTPLTTIKGYLSMILEGDVGPVTKNEKQMIQQAFDSAERMVFLIADLLNISRLQSGKFVIENKPTDLVKMVEAQVNQLKDTAANHHLTLNFNKPEKFPTLNLDETKVQQVVMNFMDNAIFYTPAGGTIDVALEATDKEVRYTVTDTGLGVPKAEQHHLFAKFYRAGNARKMRPDGTGLGLFMAKKVITAQGGAIIFKSTEGKGSTFGFSFPRAKMEVSK